MKKISYDAIEFSQKLSELCNPYNPEKEENTNKEQQKRLKNATLKIIENDLSECQKKYLMMYYMKNLNTVEIARCEGVCTSTVSRTLRRARNNIFQKLKYYLL